AKTSQRRGRKSDAIPPEGGTPAPPEGGNTSGEGGTANEDERSVDRLFSSRYACTHCGVSYEPPSPQLFSFNSPQGMCSECNGLALRHDFDLGLLIPDESLSFAKGAVPLLGRFRDLGRWRRRLDEGVATL